MSLNTQLCSVHKVKTSTAYNRRSCRCPECLAYASERSEQRGRSVSQHRRSRSVSLDKMAALRATGAQAVLDEIAAGKLLRSIATEYGVSYSGLVGWLNETPERKVAFAQAKRASAEAHIQIGEALLAEAAAEGTGLTSAQGQIAKTRAEWHRWLAGVRDSEYGERQQSGIAVNIGALHLEALRSRGSVIGIADRQSSGATVDAEILDE